MSLLQMSMTYKNKFLHENFLTLPPVISNGPRLGEFEHLTLSCTTPIGYFNNITD